MVRKKGSLIQIKRSQLAPPVLMALAIFIFHLKPLFLGVSFHDLAAFHHDFLEGGPSTLREVQEFYCSGHPPLWIANQVMGSPYLGLYLPAIVHPIILGLFRFDLGPSIALVVFTNAELIAIFAFLLFMRCGASAWASAGAGFLLCLSGFVPWVTLIYPVAFPIPWMLCWIWSAVGLSRKARLSSLAWNVVSIFMILISGDAQMVVEGAYILVAWYLLWSLFSGLSRPKFFSAMALLALCALIGWFMASVQMLPAILYFSRAVTTRTPSLGEYASTFLPAQQQLLSWLGLFSRDYRNLFLPFSMLILIGAALTRRRSNPAFIVSIIISFFIGILLLGGRSGLAAIPFNLPMLKLFIRHYKLLLIMQGPMFIGVALGFDALIDAIKGRSKPWIAGSLVCLALTLMVLPGHFWRVILMAGAFCLWLCLTNPRRFRYAPAILFGLLVVDAGSYAWQTPNSLLMPEPDPIYLEKVRELGPEARVQGMYPWIARAGDDVDQPLPVHGHGYFGEHSIDSWLEFPLLNHAYFLAAISPAIARIDNGEFSHVDFSTPFKSKDFVNPQNRHLVNLAALRYFFLQDFALAEADLIPILSDPEYLANPARPQGFEPWKRALMKKNECQKIDKKCKGERPVLVADSYGAFGYEKSFQQGDIIETVFSWDTSRLPTRDSLLMTPGSWSWAMMTYEGSDEKELLFCRAVFNDSPGRVRIESQLGVGQDGKSKGEKINFGLMPGGGKEEQYIALPVVRWIDPAIRNPEKTIRYRGGDRAMVFENEEAFSRARVVHRSRLMRNNEEALAVMRDSNLYDPSMETLLMDPDAPILDGPGPGPGEKARLARYRDDEVVVEARLDSPGYLVLSDHFYPGWRAFDDKGGELRIYRTDMAMRAVHLPQGDHTVTFRYLPVDFRIGLFVTVFTILSWMAVCVGRAAFPKPVDTGKDKR